MSITAKVVAHSRCIYNSDICTLELEYPRFIHQEFMTHRMFSRNASSSRAMSIEKNLEQIKANPAMPVHWGMNEKGMQASKEVEPYVAAGCVNQWVQASIHAINYANSLNLLGVHKQVVNRLVEPFSHIRVVVTATEWENFFALRLHPDAQPEIRELARVMRSAMDESTPNYMWAGEWHLPYVTNQERSTLEDDTLKKISVARCARVSYKTDEYDVEKDLALHDRLLRLKHLSPFEHVATPMQDAMFPAVNSIISNNSLGTNLFDDIRTWEQGITHADKNGGLWSGNFRNWVQLRQLY